MRYLVTGGTGLIGRELVPLLLARGPVDLSIRKTTAERYESLLARWRGIGSLRLLFGDVTEPGLGIAALDAGYDHVFHLAGAYDLEGDPQVIERVNVGGTQNLIHALRRSGFRGTLHHVSSIAVAGDFAGTFEEARLDAGQKHPDAYHRSKFDSEKIVRDLEDIRYRIYRPSAVVGHSRTGEMDRADGPYFMFEAIYRMQKALPRWTPLLAYQGTEMNMVPVDWVASAMDRIAHSPGQDRKTFHLVDHRPPSFPETFNLIAAAADGPRLPMKKGILSRLVPGGADILSQLGTTKFLRSEMMQDFGIPKAVQAAVNKSVRFDTTNLQAVLGPSELAPPQAEYVEKLWDYFKRNLASERNKDVRNRRVFAGKKALITGASSGIGAELAKKLARAGAEVILVARREAELADVADGIRATGGRAEILTADLSNLDECDRVVKQVLDRHGRLDLLVNNAGHSIRRPLIESLERFHDLQRVMQINFFAPARLIRGFLPGMRERSSGMILNVLSAGAHMPSPRFGAYTSSKAALSQLGDTLAAEHAADGILVTQAYLHWVRTPMMDATKAFEENDAMSPEEAADWMLDGLAERKPKLLRTTDARRYIMNTVAPRTLARLVNVVYRIYSEEAAPELDLDRTFAKKIFRGRPM
jgi:short-subunit dehydrogenase